MPDVTESRPVDPAERYYLLLDRLWPMTFAVVAQLDTTFTPDEVRTAWTATARRQTMVNTRVRTDDDGVLQLEHLGTMPIDFDAPDGPWQAVMNHELDVAFDVEHGPLARCRYVAGPDGTSTIIVTVQHAVFDGRGCMTLIQDLAAELAGNPPVHPEPLPLAPPMHDRLAPDRQFRSDRAAMLDLLRTLGAERDAAPTPTSVPWFDRSDGPRGAPRMYVESFDPEETTAIARAAKAGGFSVGAAMGAATLGAVRQTFAESAADLRLVLGTPADLRARLHPAVDSWIPGNYATMLTSTHTVGDDPFAIAPEIDASVRRAMGRGEGELFYALIRPEKLALDDRGKARIGALLDAAPPSAVVSNIGVVDHSHDPEWLRSLAIGHAPSANHLSFAVAITYRGRLTMIVGTDSRRLGADRAVEFAAGAGRALRRLVAAAPADRTAPVSSTS